MEIQTRRVARHQTQIAWQKLRLNVERKQERDNRRGGDGKGLGKDSCLCMYRKDVVRTSAWRQQQQYQTHLENIRRWTDSQRMMLCMNGGRSIVNFGMSSVDVDEGIGFSCDSCPKMNESSQRGKLSNWNYWPYLTVKTFTPRSELLRFWHCPFVAHACVGLRVHACVAAHEKERETERESTEQKRAWLTPLLKPEGAHQKIRGRKFQRAVHGVFFDESHTNYDLATVSAVFWSDNDKSTYFHLNWGSPNSSAFRRTRGKWRRKTATKACRTPESWTDLTTSLQVSEISCWMWWLPARN